jgi:hypothetical protein
MDIVERLRKSGHWEWEIENICGEAADEIERLRKALREAGYALNYYNIRDDADAAFEVLTKTLKDKE